MPNLLPATRKKPSFVKTDTGNQPKTIQKIPGTTGSLVKQNNPIGTATVTCNALNVRQGPGINYSRIGGLTNGKTVSVYEAKDGWLKIGYGTGYGYICQKYTDFKSQDPVSTDNPPSGPETQDPVPTDPVTPEDPGTNDPGTQDPIDSTTSDWKQDLVNAGNISADEIYEGSENLEYGHEKINGAWSGNHQIVVGGLIKTGAARNVSAVKTLQALLNRALKDTGLKSVSGVDAGGALSIDGQWGRNTATHLMYFIDMAGYTFGDYVVPYTVKCDANIWKDLRDKKPLNVERLTKPDADPSTLVEIPNTGGHKIVKGGDAAFTQMLADSGKSFGIISSFRAFSSHGMEAAGMSGKSGQLELFTYRVAGSDDSAAAMPTHELTGGSGKHMLGRALDLNGDYGWAKENGAEYGFTGITGETWHVNFDPNVWANSKKNPKNK